MDNLKFIIYIGVLILICLIAISNVNAVDNNNNDNFYNDIVSFNLNSFINQFNGFGDYLFNINIEDSLNCQRHFLYWYL